MIKEKDVAIIFRMVEKVTGIKRSMIESRSRDRDCHFARMIVAKSLRDYGLKYDDISAIVGRRSRSTALYLIDYYSAEYNPYFLKCAKEVKSLLKD